MRSSRLSSGLRRRPAVITTILLGRDVAVVAGGDALVGGDEVAPLSKSVATPYATSLLASMTQMPLTTPPALKPRRRSCSPDQAAAAEDADFHAKNAFIQERSGQEDRFGVFRSHLLRRLLRRSDGRRFFGRRRRGRLPFQHVQAEDADARQDDGDGRRPKIGRAPDASSESASIRSGCRTRLAQTQMTADATAVTPASDTSDTVIEKLRAPDLYHGARVGRRGPVPIGSGGGTACSAGRK